MLALASVATISGRSAASSGEGALEPNGRGMQLLGGREQILLEQSERARLSARARALTLYRLLRAEELERRRSAADPIDGPRDRLGARAVVLATAILERDLNEARAVRAELDRVRAERAIFRDRPDHRALATAVPARPPPAFAPASFLRPVTGLLVTPFGVARDPATGAWIFRAAATYAAQPREQVRSPTQGRVARVANSVAGGVAIVLSQEDDDHWTVVVSGLSSVAVSPGEFVRRGDPVGRAPSTPGAVVRIETWRGRTPVDPASVLGTR